MEADLVISARENGSRKAVKIPEIILEGEQTRWPECRVGEKEESQELFQDFWSEKTGKMGSKDRV